MPLFCTASSPTSESHPSAMVLIPDAEIGLLSEPSPPTSLLRLLVQQGPLLTVRCPWGSTLPSTQQRWLARCDVCVHPSRLARHWLEYHQNGHSRGIQTTISRGENRCSGEAISDGRPGAGAGSGAPRREGSKPASRSGGHWMSLQARSNLSNGQTPSRITPE